MKEIPLTQGKVALVDDADYEAVSKFKWYAVQKYPGNWYAARKIRRPDGTRAVQYLHQFLIPGASSIDHKNKNGLNNQRENLRACSHRQNTYNRRKRIGGTSTFKGVSWNSQFKKWATYIGFEGIKYFLGYFEDEKEAARAYDAHAIKFHKEFASLNFPSTT